MTSDWVRKAVRISPRWQSVNRPASVLGQNLSGTGLLSYSTLYPSASGLGMRESAAPVSRVNRTENSPRRVERGRQTEGWGQTHPRLTLGMWGKEARGIARGG